jgi:hypothetical protein
MGAPVSAIEQQSEDLAPTGLGDVYRASRRLGWNHKRTYYHASEGHFPPGVVVRVGHRVLFNLTVLEKWILRGGWGSSPEPRRRGRPRIGEVRP